MKNKLCLLVKRGKTIVFVEVDPDAKVSDLEVAVSKMIQREVGEFRLLLPRKGEGEHLPLDDTHTSLCDLGLSDFYELYFVYKDGEGWEAVNEEDAM